MCRKTHTATLTPAGLAVDGVEIGAAKIIVMARPSTKMATCPECGAVSGRIHSRYRRRLIDLPVPTVESSRSMLRHAAFDVSEQAAGGGRLVINATEAATAAAIAGLGIFSTGERSIRAELESGALVRVLPDWEIGSSDINVILPAGRAAKASARAFADFVAAQVRGP
jgi:DNA-binding transcriptional LysR family regulator